MAKVTGLTEDEAQAAAAAAAAAEAEDRDGEDYKAASQFKWVAVAGYEELCSIRNPLAGLISACNAGISCPVLVVAESLAMHAVSCAPGQ